MATSSRKERYDAYIVSDVWREKRGPALERAEHRCQVCNADRHLDVHHRTYERLGDERPGDLTVLCRSCHELFHEHRKVKSHRPKRTPPKKGTKKRRKKKRQPAVKEPRPKARQLKKPCTICQKTETSKGICKPCRRKQPWQPNFRYASEVGKSPHFWARRAAER